MQGEVAAEDELVALLQDGGGRELQGRVLLDVQEVSALDVTVALLVAAGEARGLDRDGRGGVLRRGTVEDQGALELAEAAADGGDHRVLRGEAEGGVGGVDDPGAGGDGEVGHGVNPSEGEVVEHSTSSS